MYSLNNRDITNEFNFNPLTTNGVLSNTVRNIKSTAGRIFGYLIHNPNGSEAFVQVFYRPSNSVILGTTAPDLIIKVAANGSVAWDFQDPRGVNSIGLSVAATTTDTGSTAPTTGLSGTIFHV